MATDTPMDTVAVTKRERTFRFDGYVPLNQAPYIDVYREALVLDSAGSIVGGAVVSTYRIQWSDFASKSWVLSTGKTITALELYEALATAFDQAAHP